MEKVDLISGYPKQSVAHHELLKVVVLHVRGVIVSVLISFWFLWRVEYVIRVVQTTDTKFGGI